MRVSVKFGGLLLAALTLWPGAGQAGRIRARESRHQLFWAAGVVYGLDPMLLEAIARVESSDDATAVSPKGAIGLLQLMPATARDLEVRDPLNPVQNVLGAARFLDYLRTRQQERTGSADLVRMLAAYNAGLGAVEKYDGIPPYRETREYVRKVLLEYLLSDLQQGVRQREEVATSTSEYVRNRDDTMLKTLRTIQRSRTLAVLRRKKPIASAAHCCTNSR